MKGLGIDVKKIAVTAAGHALGGIAVTQVNKIPFLKNLAPDKQALKGAVIAGIGYALAPLLSKKMKGTEGELLTAAGQGIGFVGTMIMANALIKPTAGSPALFPVISGVEDDNGMGNEMAGLGMIGDGYEDVSGYEQDPTVAGYEKNPMLEGVDDVI